MLLSGGPSLFEATRGDVSPGSAAYRSRAAPRPGHETGYSKLSTCRGLGNSFIHNSATATVQTLGLKSIVSGTLTTCLMGAIAGVLT